MPDRAVDLSGFGMVLQTGARQGGGGFVCIPALRFVNWLCDVCVTQSVQCYGCANKRLYSFTKRLNETAQFLP